MQLQTKSPESKFPNEYTDIISFRSKVIAKIQRGPDFMKHGVVTVDITLLAYEMFNISLIHHCLIGLNSHIFNKLNRNTFL